MSRKKLTLTTWVEPAQLEALRKLSKRSRIPMAVFVREAIDNLLVEYGFEEFAKEEDDERWDAKFRE